MRGLGGERCCGCLAITLHWITLPDHYVQLLVYNPLSWLSWLLPGQALRPTETTAVVKLTRFIVHSRDANSWSLSFDKKNESAMLTNLVCLRTWLKFVVICPKSGGGVFLWIQMHLTPTCNFTQQVGSYKRSGSFGVLSFFYQLEKTVGGNVPVRRIATFRTLLLIEGLVSVGLWRYWNALVVGTFKHRVVYSKCASSPGTFQNNNEH